MRSIRRTLARIAGMFRHDRGDDDLRAEMEAHLALEIEENLRRGMDADEARRRALIAAGGFTQATESVREQRGLPWVESLVGDLRFALRQFRRTPLSTVTMILVLSLGIGANIVLFTVVNSLATMPAPGIERNGSLVRIRGTVQVERVAGVHARTMSWPEVQQYAALTDLFGSVAAYADETAVVKTGDAASPPLTASVIYTTANYFDVLNVRPALGAEPAADANVMQAATAPSALISYAMWQQQFGGARDVIGRTIRINDIPVEIAGVAPPRFLGTNGGRGLTLWLPLAAYPQVQGRTPAVFLSNDSAFLSVAALLRPGVTHTAATATVAGIASRAFQPGREGSSTRVAGGDVIGARSESGSADVVPMLAANDRVRDRTDLILTAAGSGGFALLILLITCTNVSALMVGLAVARRREIGVRLSLGAPRMRLIRQLLTESVLLAVIAAAVGLFVTTIGISAFAASLEDVQLVIDWRVTTATAAIAIVTGILFGVSPALHATRVSVGEVLKNSSKAVAATRSRLQRSLVVVQIALTQPLLVGVGVLIATMVTDLGKRQTSAVPEQIVEIELDTWAGNLTNRERAAGINALVDRIAAMPGVTHAMPMQLGTMGAPVAVHPDDRIAGINYTTMQGRLTAAPKGFFDAFAIPLVRGRAFDAAEHAHIADDSLRHPAYTAVIVGSDLARRLFGDANAVGRRLTLASSATSSAPPMVVVGVVDAAAAGPSFVNGEFRMYVPYASINTGVIVRTAGPALPMLNALREVALTEAPRMPIYRAETMEQREAEARSDLLRASAAVAAGGMLALLLSAIGLYAVVSFGVGQRTREIGIRTALGALPSGVVRLFFLKGLGLSAIGLIIGLPLSMIVTWLIASSLNWPLTSSPLIGVGIAAVVLVVASVAVWIPARRASTIDPTVALRAE
jgi:predicted permease